MEAILHIMTILINLRCCHGNLLLWMCRETEKWRNLHICQNIDLILLKFGVGGYFWILNPKSTKNFYTTSFWRQNDMKVKYPYIACTKCIWRHYDVAFCSIFLKTSFFLLLTKDYQYTKFALIWVKENKVTGWGAESAPQVENVSNRPGEIGLSWLSLNCWTTLLFCFFSSRIPWYLGPILIPKIFSYTVQRASLKNDRIYVLKL